MKTIVIYHRTDFDGIFCREIARKFLPHAELIGWDYGDPVPTPDVVSEDDTLYMLDISVDGLMGHPRLIWIDHHKSAMEKFHHGIPGYRIDGVAACRLAWQWLSLASTVFEGDFNFEKAMTYFGVARYTDGVEPHNNNAKLPEKQDFIDRKVSEPLAVRLAGEYDIWDKRDPRAELFQHSLRSRELTEFDWNQMLSFERPTTEDVERLISVGHQNMLEPDGSCAPAVVWGLLDAGKVVQYAKNKENDSIITSAGFTVQFDGLKFLACNHARFNSHLFTAGLKPEHEALLGFCFDGNQWKVSLYHAPGKEHHDLSQIAVKYGGGGHRGACGFRIDKLPFY